MTANSILIIGCGSIGERHLRCFLKTGRVSVTACEPRDEIRTRMAKDYSVPTETDWSTAVQTGRFSAAVICTPAPLHVPMAIRALDSGIHVLVEKPLSHSLNGVEELFRARVRSGRQVAVAYIYHQFPALIAARNFLAENRFGPVRQVSVSTGQPFHLLRPAYADTYYRERSTGGGAIQDALTHVVNWVESVVGPTDSVLCDCAHQVLPGVEVEDTVHVSTRNGPVLVSYALNQFQAPNESFIQLNSADGSVRIEFHRHRWGHFAAGATDWTWQETPVPDRDTHFINQAHAFLDLIEGKPSRLCSLEAGAQTLRFNLAALASAERGGRVATMDIS